MKRMRNLKGFTLIELIVVILILGILAAIAVVGYTNITDKAKATAQVANAKQIVTSLSADATLNGSASVDAFLTGPAIAGPDGDILTVADNITTQAYLDAKFLGVKTVYSTGSVKVGSLTVPANVVTTGAVAQLG